MFNILTCRTIPREIQVPNLQNPKPKSGIQYFNHGTSHYLGLDTHDVGDRGPLQPGMVITVEPGIYISEGAEIDKAYWNIGVRIEDDVLVTEDGHKLLSHKAPSEIADIEKIMKEENKLFSILD